MKYFTPELLARFQAGSLSAGALRGSRSRWRLRRGNAPIASPAGRLSLAPYFHFIKLNLLFIQAGVE
jgi:hypothetical protein